MSHLSRSSRLLFQTTATLLPVLFLAALVIAQTPRNRTTGPAEEEPVFHEYRGVQIGWLADEVRKKLGNPANKDDEQDFYVFGEKETAQFVYDKTTHKVVTISVDFMNGATGVPTPQQVFGSDVESKADGSRYRMVRYPKAGYWITYNRTPGEAPMISITLQKLMAQ